MRTRELEKSNITVRGVLFGFVGVLVGQISCISAKYWEYIDKNHHSYEGKQKVFVVFGHVLDKNISSPQARFFFLVTFSTQLLSNSLLLPVSRCENAY